MSVSPTGGDRSAELAILKQGGAIVAREAGASDLGLRPAGRPASTASNRVVRFMVDHHRSGGIAAAAMGAAELTEALPVVGTVVGFTGPLGRLAIGGATAMAVMKAGEGAGYVKEQSTAGRIMKAAGAGVVAALLG